MKPDYMMDRPMAKQDGSAADLIKAAMQKGEPLHPELQKEWNEDDHPRDDNGRFGAGGNADAKQEASDKDLMGSAGRSLGGGSNYLKPKGSDRPSPESLGYARTAASAPVASGHHSVAAMEGHAREFGMKTIESRYNTMGGHASRGNIEMLRGLNDYRNSLRGAGYHEKEVRQFPNKTSAVVGYQHTNQSGTVQITTYHSFSNGEAPGNVVISSQTKSR